MTDHQKLLEFVVREGLYELDEWQKRILGNPDKFVNEIRKEQVCRHP